MGGCSDHPTTVKCTSILAVWDAFVFSKFNDGELKDIEYIASKLGQIFDLSDVKLKDQNYGRSRRYR